MFEACRISWIFFWLTLMPFGIGSHCLAQDKPNKEELIETLRSVCQLLEQKKYEDASKYFAMPPGAKPSDLAPFLQRQEISSSGIDVLSARARFGSARELFGDDRAKHFASKTNVVVDDVYGFRHETKFATAEVLAVWQDNKIQLIRLDDVGKLRSPDEKGAVSEVSGEMETAKAAIVELASKVESNPSDANLRAKYAMHLFNLKRYDDSWEQIQVAYKVAPDHSGIARGIDALVNKFMLAGAFAVGTSMDDIKELLGEPNRSVPLGADRVRLLYAHWGVDFKNAKIHEIVNLQGATEALYQPTETISIDLDGRPWRPGLRRKIKDRVVSFWYIKGQGVTDWKEQIVIDRILGGGKFGSPVQIAERQIKDERKIDAQIKSKIWESDESSAMLTLVKTDRGSQQYQLVRIFKGPVDLHRITYTIKSDQPPEQSVLNNWMAIFKSAKLENVKR